MWGTLTISGDGIVDRNTTVSSRNSEATSQIITSSVIPWAILTTSVPPMTVKSSLEAGMGCPSGPVHEYVMM